MTKRFFSSLPLLATLCVGILSLTGCDDRIASPDPFEFGSVRVLNLAPCQGAMDVYLTAKGDKEPEIASVSNIVYGVASVYRTNLPTNRGAGQVYTLRATPVNQPSKTILETEVTLHGDDKYTWAIYFDKSNNRYIGDMITDAPGIGKIGVKETYVRFLQSYDVPGTYTLRIDDPLSGDKVGSLSYRQMTDYVPIETALDTSYTFYLIEDATGKVLSRIAGQSFAPGSYHTVFYGWDSCRTFGTEDPKGDEVDSLRIRILDDNDVGSDQTSSLPRTLRYNIINGLIPVALDNDGGRGDTLFYQSLGFVINNDTRITFPNVYPKEPAPRPAGNVGGIQQVFYAATLLTDAINIKAFKMDDAKPNVRGTQVFDMRVGPRANVVSDFPTSLVIADTVYYERPASKLYADSTHVQHGLIPIPDVPHPDSFYVTFVNGTAGLRRPHTKIENTYVDFVVDGETDPRLKDKNRVNNLGKAYATIAYAGDRSMNIVGKMEQGTAPVVNAAGTFEFKRGGIYMVVLTGQRGNTQGHDPKLLVIQTNPKR